MWDKLIAECDALDQQAQTIQHLQTQAETIKAFQQRYEEWYEECLIVLPKEFQTSFVLAYAPIETTSSIPSIRKFLDYPILQGDTSQYWYEGKQIELTWIYPYYSYFHVPLVQQRSLLVRARKRATVSIPDRDALANVHLVIERFAAVTHQLTTRQKLRPPLMMQDEADVQDLLRALLALFFDEVAVEVAVPEYAGANSKIDFLLEQEQIGIETKMTRVGLLDRELGEQISIDVQRYTALPTCKTLVFFVYDPMKRVKQPRKLERELTQTINGMIVEVFVVQG